MRRSFRNSSANKAISNQQSAISIGISLIAGCWLLAATFGCEGLQKKFVRKPKPHVRPSPIISFQDYTRAISPLDRYRKHYAMFDYWNAELLDALGTSLLNAKRAKRASAEALKELQILQGLLEQELASQAGQILAVRARIDQQIQQGSYAPSQLGTIRRTLEVQSRQVHRELFWRRVEDQLKTVSGDP